MTTKITMTPLRAITPPFLKLIYKAFRAYKAKVLVLIGLGLFSSSFEAVGVSAVIPLFSFLTGASRGTDVISQTVEKAFDYAGVPFTMRYVLLFVILLFLLRAVALLISNYLRIKITADYEEKTRSSLLSQTMKADWSHLLKQKLGHLETITMVNAAHGERILNTASSLITIITGLIIYVTVALNISSTITLMTMALGVVVLLIARPLLSRIQNLSREVELANRQVTHHISQNIVGLKTIKSMQVNRQVAELGNKFFEQLRQLKVKIALLRLLPISMMQPLGLIFVVLLFSIYYKSPDFHLAAFVAVIYLIQRIFIYVEQFQSQLHIAGESAPFLQEMVNYQEEVYWHKEKAEGTEPFSFESELVLQNVEFAYSAHDLVLHEINFTVPKGSVVGVIGPSGSGKTTIVDLLLRMFKPSRGKILIDGKNIQNIGLHEWRNNIGYVTQDVFLVNDTIENNIRFFNPDLSHEDIEKAARMADIYDFVDQLPARFSTEVGERGVFLSGGQRQRIIIARILARKPKILILDEATSSLDIESELQIQRVIEKFKGEITVVIIAHRLSTITSADKVVVLEKGRIVEEGSPSKLLMDKDSYFSRVYSLQ